MHVFSCNMNLLPPVHAALEECKAVLLRDQASGTECEIGTCFSRHGCCPAGGEAGAEVRRELEAKRNALVANYAAKRDALIAEILPEVLILFCQHLNETNQPCLLASRSRCVLTSCAGSGVCRRLLGSPPCTELLGSYQQCLRSPQRSYQRRYSKHAPLFCCQASAEPAAGYNDEWLAGIIDRLSEFDREMNTVVVDSGILAGVLFGALMRAGECT